MSRKEREMERKNEATPTQQAGDGQAVRALRPYVDAYENEGGLLILADLPGVRREDLDIQCENGLMTLAGRRQIPRSGQWVEYRRRFNLPHDIDLSNVSAKLEQGVLRVELPRAEAYRPRRISVQAG